MNFTDFEYNGRRLSEFGCIICCINSGGGLETKDIGNKITFNKLNFKGKNNAQRFKLADTTYEEAFTTTFEIAKYNCNNVNDNYMSDEEARTLVKWLNQKTFHKFKMIYTDGQFSNIYYNGSFNIQMIVLGEKILGLSLTFESESPYGFYEPIIYNMDFSGDNKEFCIYDSSDESGFIYPEVKIEILEDGNLTLSNSMSEEKTVISGCTVGEIITLDGNNKLISSNKRDSTISNYFNYNFPKVINKNDEFYSEEEYAKNVYATNLKCNISLSYSPIAKIGVI